MLIYLYLVLLLTQTVKAQPNKTSQTLSGIIVYQQKIAVRTLVNTYDTLRFDRTKSIFSWNLYNPPQYGAKKASRRFPGAKKVGGPAITGQVNLLNTTKDSLFSRMSLRQLNAVLYLKEKTPPIKWEIVDSTKKIGRYDVKKATAHFRGRNYTAWFTPKVPVPYGPWKLHGLPGLILQAYDESGNIYFSATQIEFTDVEPIRSISLNGKEQNITLAQYKEIVNHFKKYEKSATIKQVRKYVSKEELSELPIHLSNVDLMETFQDSTDQ